MTRQTGRIVVWPTMAEAAAADTPTTRYVGRCVVWPSIAQAQANVGQPSNTVLPVVTGALTVGSVLTCSNGTWVPAATSYSFTWKRGATTVGGTGNTYTLVAGDLGATMSCTVTASNTAGSGTATSAGRGPVA